MSVMKVVYEKCGGHYHCTIFTARQRNMTYANCGYIVFDEREWEDIQLIMSGAQFVKKEKILCPTT